MGAVFKVDIAGADAVFMGVARSVLLEGGVAATVAKVVGGIKGAIVGRDGVADTGTIAPPGPPEPACNETDAAGYS